MSFIYGHHASKESLDQSKRKGCIACSNIDDGNVESLDRFGYCTIFAVNFVDGNDGTEFEMFINPNDGYQPEQIVAFAPYPRRIQFLHSNLTDSTEDPATWDLVEWWLSTCVATHEACAVTSQSSWVPTRLLKLHAANNTFQLVWQSDVRPGSRYAALSHCWGSKSWASNVILNSDNDATLFKQQPVAILPKTFRDAFTIVLRLNLQYLWIDRFCIYQDSRDDWGKESSMMHNVYRNSFICISALSAIDDDGGCFFTRDIEVVKPSILNFSKDGVSQPTLYTSYRNDSHAWKNAFSQEVLTSRAWVLQERLLAPRTLHFGKNQIYWECNEEYRSETEPEHEWRRAVAPEHTASERISELRTTWKALIGQKTPYKPDPTAALELEWLNILDFYSSCKLSQGEDKLVAISAIVKDMKRHLKGLGKPADYFAGIWGLWLPQHLLWSVTPETMQKHRPRQYRAPSWSWASVDSTVLSSIDKHMYSNEGWVASVSSVVITHLTDDDTGQVAGGALTLRGRPVRVFLEKLTGELAKRHTVAKWWVKGFETAQGISLERNSDKGRDVLGLPNIVFDTEEEMSECVLFLPISVEFLAFNQAAFQGLLLASSGSDYKRVGYMDLGLMGSLGSFVQPFVHTSERFRYGMFEEIEEHELRIV